MSTSYKNMVIGMLWRSRRLKKTVREKKIEKSLSGPIDLTFLEKDMAIENLRGFLISSLVVYVLARSKDPISAVLHDLLKIEIEAGRILGKVLKSQETPIELKGYLAGVISFTGSSRKTKSKGKVTSKKLGFKAK